MKHNQSSKSDIRSKSNLRFRLPLIMVFKLVVLSESPCVAAFSGIP